MVALGGLVVGGLAVAVAGAGSPDDGLDPSCDRRTSPEPVVAVIDSGVVPLPVVVPRLAAPRIDLTGEEAGRPDPHGTAMAGIVADRAPEARLLDVRVLDEDGRAPADRLAAGVARAVDEGAEVVNVSAEVPAGHPPLVAALRRADREGAVVVLAAGNEGRDLDDDPSWAPVAALPCVVVVGAGDGDGELLGASNRGERTLDVVAPGASVATTGPDGAPTTAVGTSAAAAVVSGRLAAG
ncbi:S8 family serine peptidase [Iamia majanohamensis]|uniref:S8 family serine peptidase n=1 Tax=Iamia majanohamensis TaxID=467976 RepID=A0AAF0BR06_9ACTN|nr:S8 family serine peptidase [Iamia majanohamensis]WCO65736.1 S8 family serine peptidase [Iamia majanohamensis]